MDVFQGFIAAFGFNYPPRNWVTCAGQLLAISDNQALYSLLSDYYGGDSRTVYGIPELRGRAAIGYGTSPGQPTYPIGLKYGNIQNVLTVDELPSHTHTATVTGGGGQVSGVLYASQANASHEQPQPGDYLATGIKVRGDVNKNYVPAADKGTIVPLGGLEIDGDTTTPTVTNSLTGGGDPFSIIQPILAINYCLATQGIYPPRN